MNKIITTLIVMIITLSFVGVASALPQETHEYNYRDTIYIIGDDEFTFANGVSSGDGTENNPYIIENWYINVTEYLETGDYYGIVVVDTTSNFTIKNCYITNTHTGTPKNNAHGILFGDTYNGVVSNCFITEQISGILTDGYCENITIQDNIFYNNGDMHTSPVEPPNPTPSTDIELFTCKNITIKNNIFNNSYQEAILVDLYSEDILITENNFINVGMGIIIDSSDCLIYHNNFISLNSTLEFAYDEIGSAIWDNGTEGNYWSDYTGIDADGNGIGDTPYDVDSGSNEDRYPLMTPYVWEIDESTIYTTLTEFLSGIIFLLIFILIFKKIIESINDILKQEKNKK